jgi:membrane-bound serine protease (ClpP class)
MLNKLLVPLGLQIMGVLVIIAELLLPSGGILTIVACGIFGYSLYMVFLLSKSIGLLVFSVDLILIPILVLIGIKMLANSPVTLKETLSKKGGATSQNDALQELVGKKGTVINDLRPAGRALIENKRYDVVSEGDYIIKDSSIIVSSVNGNRIVVKKIN